MKGGELPAYRVPILKCQVSGGVYLRRLGCVDEDGGDKPPPLANYFPATIMRAQPAAPMKPASEPSFASAIFTDFAGNGRPNFLT